MKPGYPPSDPGKSMLPNSLAAQGMNLPPKRDEVALPPTPGSDTPVDKSASMMTYIQPSARDRWLASYVHYYKPQIVENICRGAMAGNLLAQWLMFDLMEQTWPRLMSNLNVVKDAVVALDWKLQPYAVMGKKASPEAIRRAQVIDELRRNMQPDIKNNENDFEDLLRDAMDAIGKGISVQEIDWELKDNFWLPRCTRWVHPRYYGWPSYGFGVKETMQDRMMLFAQEIAFSNPEYSAANGSWSEFPENKFIISIIKQKSGHPLSGSLLRVLAFFWAAQNFTWEWFINLAQIFGAPLRWATYDETRKNLLPVISGMLRQMGSSAWAAFPAGTQVNFEKGVENARENPQKVLIESADEICDIAILGQTLTTSQGQRGSQALGKIHKSVRDEKIDALSGRIAKIVNRQFIRAICMQNFGDDTECPWLQPSSKEKGDRLGKAQFYQTVASMGLPIAEQAMYEDLDLTPPESEDDTFIAPNVGNSGLTPDKPENEATANASAIAQARGVNALDTLTNNVLEGITGVQAKWLSGIKPVFRNLVAMAKDGEVSDAEFVKALEHAQRHFPELFKHLDTEALAQAMEKAMGAAAVNGAVHGYMRRRAA